MAPKSSPSQDVVAYTFEFPSESKSQQGRQAIYCSPAQDGEKNGRFSRSNPGDSKQGQYCAKQNRWITYLHQLIRCTEGGTH